MQMKKNVLFVLTLVLSVFNSTNLFAAEWAVDPSKEVTQTNLDGVTAILVDAAGEKVWNAGFGGDGQDVNPVSIANWGTWTHNYVKFELAGPASNNYFIHFVNDNGENYVPRGGWHDGSGILNITGNGTGIFIGGKGGTGTGQDGANRGVWTVTYEQGKGYALHNVGANEYASPAGLSNSVIYVKLYTALKDVTDPNDRTSLINNPLVNGADGWTCERPNGGNGPLLNNNSFEYWAGNATGGIAGGSFNYYQVINNLPEGKYIVKADMYNTQAAAPNGNCGLYAKTANSEVFVGVTEDGDQLKNYATEAIVVRAGEALTIGVKNKGTMSAQWFVADNFKLIYAGELYPELLQNYSFETLGSVKSGTNYNIGEPWTWSIGSQNIRVQKDNNLNEYVLVWRGSGNNNYFSQPVASLKPNTYYAIQVNQVSSGNAGADFNVGIGTAAGKYDVAATTVRLGNTVANDIKTVYIKTPATINGSEYFTFANTSNNTATSGSDPVSQIAWVSLKETNLAQTKALALDEVPVADGGIFTPNAADVAAIKAAINAATSNEAVYAALAEVADLEIPALTGEYTITNVNAALGMNISSTTNITLGDASTVTFERKDGQENEGFIIKNADDEYVYYSANNTWSLSASKEHSSLFAVEYNDGKYAFKGRNGYIGSDATGLGSVCYGNKTTADNGLWTVAEYVAPAIPEIGITFYAGENTPIVADVPVTGEAFDALVEDGVLLMYNPAHAEFFTEGADFMVENVKVVVDGDESDPSTFSLFGDEDGAWLEGWMIDFEKGHEYKISFPKESARIEVFDWMTWDSEVKAQNNNDIEFTFTTGKPSDFITSAEVNGRIVKITFDESVATVAVAESGIAGAKEYTQEGNVLYIKYAVAPSEITIPAGTFMIDGAYVYTRDIELANTGKVAENEWVEYPSVTPEPQELPSIGSVVPVIVLADKVAEIKTNTDEAKVLTEEEWASVKQYGIRMTYPQLMMWNAPEFVIKIDGTIYTDGVPATFHSAGHAGLGLDENGGEWIDDPAGEHSWQYVDNKNTNGRAIIYDFQPGHTYTIAIAAGDIKLNQHEHTGCTDLYTCCYLENLAENKDTIYFSITTPAPVVEEGEQPAPGPDDNNLNAPEATVIAGVATETETPVAVFATSGARLATTVKGINVVKMANGKVKKTFVK